MAETSIIMCDIEKCRAEANEHLPVMLICKQKLLPGGHSDSFKIYTRNNIDLCGKHEIDYRHWLSKFEFDVKGNKD